MLHSVLIVDDNELIRLTLRAMLRAAGFEVLGEARNGESALAMVEHHQPDIVCLDVNMPGMSGLDVLSDVRKNYPSIKVVMVTGTVDRDSVKAMIAAGAAGIIVKPFNAARITETLQRLRG